MFWRLLTAFLLVTLLPLGILGYVLGETMHRNLSQDAADQLSLRLDKVSAQVSGYADQHLAVLRALAASPEIVTMDAQRQTPLLTGLTAARKDVALAFVIQPDGKNEARSDGGKPTNYADRQYFQQVAQGAATSLQVVISKTSGKPTLAMAVPIKRDGVLVGVLAQTVLLEQVSAYVQDLQVGRTGFAWLVDADNRVMAHRDQKLVQAMADQTQAPAVQRARKHDASVSPVTADGQNWLATQRVLPQGWVVVVQMPEAEALAPQHEMDRRFLTVSGAVLVGVVLLAWLVALSISRPVRRMGAFVGVMAQGDFTATLTLRRRDELGAMADALRTLQGSVLSHTTHVQHTAAGVSQTARELAAAGTEANEAQHTIAVAFQQTLGDVEAATSEQRKRLEAAQYAVADLTAAVDQIAGGATHQATEVSRATEVMIVVSQQAEVVSGGIARLAASSEQTAVLAQDGATTVEGALGSLEVTQEKVDAAASTVRELYARSSDIDTILREIAAIADQTNLLALNAAIEAARAGDAGRGFAVVADEVRRLADRSVVSAGQIGKILATVQLGLTQAVSAMEQGTAAAHGGAADAEKARQSFASILAAVQAGSREAHDIRQAAQTLLGGHQELAEMVQSLAAVAEENSAAAEEMAAAGQTVSGDMQRLDSLAMQNFAAIQGVGGPLTSIATAVERMLQAVALLEGTNAALVESVSAFRV